MPNKCKAVVLEKFNEPLKIRTYPIPEKMGEGSILVKTSYAGICGTDIHLQHGKLDIPTPIILGHEAVGRVDKIGGGTGVEDINGEEIGEGDLIGWVPGMACGECYWCKIVGKRNLCQNRRSYGVTISSKNPPHLFGGWSEYVYLEPGVSKMKIPGDVTAKEVIALGCGGPTSAHGVIFNTKMEPGDTVVVQGSGPVGIAASLYARLSGAKKIIIVGGPKKRLDILKENGIGSKHINIFEVEDPKDRIKAVLNETTLGRGAEVVLECVGFPQAVKEGWEMVKRNGKYLVLGHYADEGPIELNPHIITQKEMKVYGSWGWCEPHYKKFVELLPRLKKLFPLEDLVTEFSLEEANEAIAKVESGELIKGVFSFE